MSEKLLRFFLLSECKMVRIHCYHCEGIVEIAVGKLDDRFKFCICPLCEHPWKPSGSKPGEEFNAIKALADAIGQLSKIGDKAEIEFVLPVESPCRLDRPA